MKWFRKQIAHRLVIEYIGHNHDGHNYFTIYWKGKPMLKIKRGKYE